MGKAKTAQKFSALQKQEKVKPMHKVIGGPCNGYKVIEPHGGEVVFSCENMWDAIDERNRLNGPQ